MADMADEKPEGFTDKPSPWDCEPNLVRLEIASWEHAARVPDSSGKAARVADLQRLLPDELTGPIYEMMARAEALFLRRTEPLPPFRERLARDFLDCRQGSESGAGTTAGATDRHTLEGEVEQLLSGTRKLGDVVPGWDAKVAVALGADAVGIARSIRNFAGLGLPREEFSLWYGYRLHVRRLPITLRGSPLATHGALLLGCAGPVFQPGPLRETHDLLCRLTLPPWD